MKLIHSNDFLAISNLEELKDTKQSIMLSSMLNNEKKKYGTNCWRIGDSIISMEAPKETFIFTTNKKDYVPICSVLGKKIYQEEI